MKNAQLLLFENNVYSTDPEDQHNQFIGPDVLYYYMFKSSDQDIFDIIDPKKLKQEKLFSNTKLFILDPVVTKIRLECRKYQQKQRNREYDLLCACKIIADDHYPVYVEYIRKFKRWTPKRQMALTLGEYSITFGREKLVEMIQSVKYEKALPQLREIILHDTSSRMNQAAICALGDMRTKRAGRYLNALLQEVPADWRLGRLVSIVEKLPFDFMIEGLTYVFEKNYHYYPEDFSDIHYGETIQQKVFEACRKIPTLQALKLLEAGIGHPYNHLERTAYFSINEWTKLMLSRIANGEDDGVGLKVAETIKKYDQNVFSESYNILRKHQKLLPREH